MTSFTPYVGDLIVLSGTLRVVLAIMFFIAAHDVTRNGLYVRRVPMAARLVFYAVGVSIAASASASMFRIAGQPWSPVFRELAHCSVSLSFIAVCFLVLAARTVAGQRYSPATGCPIAFTESGPTRDVRKDLVRRA